MTAAPPIGRAFAASNVRCATLIGHVDHGKSSYADSLLAANNIISARQAGKLRYLDSREDEQERGITMESSAVSLAFKMRGRKQQGEAGEAAVVDYSINLIDTPGHVDFSSEVSTASRLCDGALVIVDVVEGVCTQTITVLRQAWQDRLAPILVLNKMDRLISELKLSPSEAYHHLSNLLESVNAVMGGFFASERMDDDLRWHEAREKRLRQRREERGEDVVGAEGGKGGDEAETEAAYQELDDEDIYFDPVKGNVIFASAIDGWAFRLERFSHLYAKKLGIQEARFRQVLWGDFYFDPRSKRIVGHKQKEREKRNLKIVFVQFVLENIWAVYESAANRDTEKIEKIVKTLELRVAPRDLRSKEASPVVQAILSQWLPLASCTFAALVARVPSPADGQGRRIAKMLQPDLSYSAKIEASTALERDLFEAKAGDDARRCAYVSKMFAVRRADLPEKKRKELTAEEMRRRGREARERAAAAAAAAAANGVENGVQLDGDKAPPAPAESTPVPEATPADEDSPDDEVILGFARLYSGTARVGQSLWALLPKYKVALGPRHPANAKHLRRVEINGLYMMMGRDLSAVNEVPAGNVFAISGLEGAVLRNATLCGPPGASLEASSSSSGGDTIDDEAAKDCFVNLTGAGALAAPIVRVALEPENPVDMPKLVEGLKLLNQADPCVETLVQDTGEHVILTAGELHLERCLKDLRERFARCAIQASAPLVPFRETAVKASEMAPPKTEGALRGTIPGSIAGGIVVYQIRAAPLPIDVTQYLLANSKMLRRLAERERRGDDEDDGDEGGSDQNASTDAQGRSIPIAKTAERFWEELERRLAKAGPQWKDLVSSIWAFGPRRVGPNFLVDKAGLLSRGLRSRTEARRLAGDGRPSEGLPTPGGSRTPATDVNGTSANQLADALQSATMDEKDDATTQTKAATLSWSIRDLLDAVDTGFQIASLQGPMCAEPMQGMAFFVEKLQVDEAVVAKEQAKPRLSQVTGSLISSVREACKNGLLDWSPRLMLAMYSCDIQASTDVLGKVHAVLSRRRGRITSEEMKEGTSFFTVGAMLPVVESFGFADEIRKRTSGAASPQLIFKGYELFDIDPYWVPRTVEELEDLGEKGERENVAKRYMDQIRKRKGMFVDARIVEAAEKQRTLKSN